MLVPLPSRFRPTAPDKGGGRGEPELLVVLALFWVVSLVRVVGAIVRHEGFGAEATLALMAVLAIPWLTLGRYAERRVPRASRPAERTPLRRV